MQTQSSWKTVEVYNLIPERHHNYSGSPALTHLIAIIIHGQQAQQMVHVTALAKSANQLWLDAFVLQDSFIS